MRDSLLDNNHHNQQKQQQEGEHHHHHNHHHHHQNQHYQPNQKQNQEMRTFQTLNQESENNNLFVVVTPNMSTTTEVSLPPPPYRQNAYSHMGSIEQDKLKTVLISSCPSCHKDGRIQTPSSTAVTTSSTSSTSSAISNIIDTDLKKKKNRVSKFASMIKLVQAIGGHTTRIIFIIFSVILFLLLLLILLSLAKHFQNSNICLTQTCVTEAAKIIRSLDETVEPCDDFYQFVCGQWLQTTIIPEHKPIENKFDELHDILNRQVKAILDDDDQDDTTENDLERIQNQNDEPDFVRNMKLFYKSCMNVTEIDRKGPQPLIDLIDKLGGWPILQDTLGLKWSGEDEDKDESEKFSLVNIHKRLSQLGVIDDMIIPLIVTSYDKNNSRNILAIKEPSFGLMNREFMIKENNDTHIRTYFHLMLYSLELLRDYQTHQMMLKQKSSESIFTSDISSATTNMFNVNEDISTMPTTESPPFHFQRKPLVGSNGQPFRIVREFTFEMDDIHLEPSIVDEMRQVLEFEQTLAENSIKKEDRGNVSQLFNNMTISHLQEISPNITWLELINAFALDERGFMTNETEIVAIDLNYVTFLSDILPRTPKRLLANYIVWRVVKSKIGVLDSTWRRLKQTYNSVNLGHPKIEPRWMQCVAHTHATLGTALSNVYVKNYFSIKEKTKIDDIVWQIRAELNETISQADWMDTETRKHALDKLKLMNFRIGFPDEILDDELVSKFYENLTMTDDYFENVISIHKFEVENAFKSLLELNSRNDWRKYSEVVDVNAYYFHQENSFILNAGILQDRFFHPDRPNYLNYGSIGEIIGHEITHGFDTVGKQFDKTGQLKNWWNPIASEKYEERAQCMVEQYDHYSFDQIQMNVNGLQTKDENIADNLGVSLAYRAYVRAYYHKRHWSSLGRDNVNEEQLLPGLDFNPKQLFWISYGLENCEKMTNEMLKLTLEVDTHSPGRFRLNGVVSNSKYFANDFGCQLGTKMNPETKCQVW